MSTIIGALAGSIASSRVKMDLFGVIVCGTLAALGGGTVRDLLLDIPVYWTLPSGEIFVLAAVITSLATFYLAQKYPPPPGHHPRGGRHRTGPFRHDRHGKIILARLYAYRFRDDGDLHRRGGRPAARCPDRERPLCLPSR
ncbi:TRIC cation channel family protein [Akkermansia muciniphila]|nr:TRIC cation channel family protein [Candidatus Akkermansia timonensis]QWP71467.1 TRIC cation channel family protein [Akkermansia muciniphila]